MNILEVCSILQLLKKETVSFADIGSIIGISRQYVSKMKNDELDDDKLKLIENYYNVKLPKQFDIVETDKELNGKGRFYKIQYWSGPSADLIKKYGVDDLNVDLQIIINDWHTNPEKLMFIAMPGDDMDGGDYPIKNKDILVIDTSRNNIAESGVYFCTTHGHSRVYVRRIIEKMTDEIVCVTTVDNPRYKSIIEKKWTEEAWKAADVQVIGRVIKNMSYTI